MNDSVAPKPRAKLLNIDSNPMPKEGRVGYVETSDGVRLRYARWQSLVRPTKGTVIILQGRAEYIEKYFETIGELRERGFGVLSFDWRGQGGSDRLLADPKKGHIEHFNQYLTDFETILSEIALPDCSAPYFVLGHSTGSLVALLAAPALANRIQRMVLLAPLLRVRNLPVDQKIMQRITGLLSFFGFGRVALHWKKRKSAPRSFLGNNLTSDTSRFSRNARMLDADPSLELGSPTISWVFSACRAMERVQEPEFVGSITIPTLLIAAGNDPVVSPEAIEELGDRMRSGAYLTVFGAKHELLHERESFRQQVLSAFDAFVPGTTIS